VPRSTCAPGNWYLSLDLEVGGDGLLVSVTGNGRSPEAAVEDAWKTCTTLPVDRYLVLRPGDNQRRRHYRWNGFGFQEVARA